MEYLENMINIRVDNDLVMRLQMYSRREGMNLSEVIRQALEEYLSIHNLGRRG